MRGFILEWLNSYLIDRSQHVEIQNTKYMIKNISKGVPQVSVLGPILFLVYISDMNKCSDLKLVQYADDSTVYTSNTSLYHLIEHVNF